MAGGGGAHAGSPAAGLRNVYYRPPAMPESEPAEGSSYGRSAALLSAALGAAGLLTYAFFALASHALDPEDYGRIVVLWSLMFIAISVLFRPVEQLLSRTLAELDVKGASPRHTLRAAAAIQLGLALVFTAAALLFHDRLESELFDGEEALFAALLASVLGFAASFYARGYLAGTGHFGSYSILLIVDAVARAAFALVVAIGLASGVETVALGIAIAPALSVLVVPLALHFERRAAGARPRAVPEQSDEPEFTLAQGGGFAAAILVIMLSEQVFLNSGPLLARGEAGTAAAGFIFNILMLVRAPVVLFQATATSLLPHLTRLLSSGDEDSHSAFLRSIRATLIAIAGFATITTLVVLIAGPQLMQAAFGGNFTYDRLGLVLIAVAMGFYLGATTLNQAALAQGQARRAALCWAGSAVLFIGWNLLPTLEIFRRVEVGFLGVAVLLFGLLYLVYRNPDASERPLTPGSPSELEARLAAADEAI